MGFPRARTFGFVALGAVACGAAQAEQLHMPFDCRADGGRVLLRPSEDRSYDVVGPRKREIYTACSPSNPDRCRSWFVHRFEFYCGGARVSWLDAAASASRFAGREAWVEDGRMHMRMGPAWGATWGAMRGAMGGPAWDDERDQFPRRRGMRRDEAPENADAFGDAEDFMPRGGEGGRIVTLPPGFAPALGVPLTFSGGAPDDLAEDDAAPRNDSARVADAAPVAIPALPERAPRKEQRIAAAAPVPPKPTAAPAPAAKPSVANDLKPAPSKVADAAPAMQPAANEPKSPPQPEVKEPTKPSGGAASAGTGSVTPTIINGPRAAATEPAVTPATPSLPPAEAKPDTAEKPATLAVETHAETAVPAATASVTPSAASSPALATPPAAAPPKLEATVLATAATALVLTGFAAFGFWRWKRSPAPAPGSRDFASVSLEGGRNVLALEPAAPDPHALPSPVQTAAAGESANDLRIPTSYAEALEVLGANPDASIAAIKKIVDGLRQSWHPDLAKSDADRAYREARVQQVNVAWDLVSQQRTAA